MNTLQFGRHRFDFRLFNPDLTFPGEGGAWSFARASPPSSSRLLFHVFSGAVGGFFVWHAFHGERGIAADLEYRRQMAEVEAKLKVMRAEKADWQQRVDLLRGP